MRFFSLKDTIRAVTGKDPDTDKELSTKERLIAAGWMLLNIIPVGKVLSVAGKVIKYGGKMVVGAVGKAGKVLLDGAKKVSSKLHEGVSFLALKEKGLSNKIGDLWNKGKTKVKNDFIEADKAFRYAMKKMGEYVPKSGRGLAFETQSAGKIPSGGKNLLKDAYQYMKDTGEKVFGGEAKNVKITNPLSKRNSEYIKQHTLDSVIQQSKYLDDAKLSQKLAKDSYFNPNWSLEEINKYAKIAYNDLLSQGKTGRIEYEINGEILDVFIHPDGKFGSVYGGYKYTVEEIRNLTK